MFALIKFQTRWKKGHFGSKTTSLGQILEKPYICSRDLFLVQIFIKLGQNVCLDGSRTNLKMGHVGSKTGSLGQILESQCGRLR